VHGIDKNADMFFLNNHLICINTIKEYVWAIFRISDATKLCSFPAHNVEFLYDAEKDADTPPYITGLVDKLTKKLYPATLNSMIHLGAT
jgi:hypothetical protein